jgi:hypothetical protein
VNIQPTTFTRLHPTPPTSPLPPPQPPWEEEWVTHYSPFADKETETQRRGSGGTQGNSRFMHPSGWGLWDCSWSKWALRSLEAPGSARDQLVMPLRLPKPHRCHKTPLCTRRELTSPSSPQFSLSGPLSTPGPLHKPLLPLKCPSLSTEPTSHTQGPS